MQICDEELSQPSQQVPAAELLHIHILHIIMTMCPSRGWRTEDRAVGGGESNSWAATEAGPPAPSQGLFSTLCRYKVDIQYLSTSKEYLQLLHSLVYFDWVWLLERCCVRKVNIWTGPSPRTNSSPLSTIVGVTADCWDNTRYQEQQ